MPKESLLASMPKLILAVVLIVCVGAVMGLMGYALTKKATEIKTPKTETPKEIIEDETADWQTYRNEEFGFEVKYPSDFSPQKVFQVEPDGMIFSVGNTVYNFSISEYSEKYVLEKKVVYTEEYCSKDGGYNDCMFWSAWLNEWNEDSEIFISKLNDDSCKKECDSIVHRFGCTDCETVLFDNKKAIRKIKYPLPNEDYFHWSLTIEKGSNRFYLDLASNFRELVGEEGVISQDFSLQQLVSNQKDKEPKEIFDKILSSFKFIEKDETADWQTYRNEEYGFEVKYPMDWEPWLTQPDEFSPQGNWGEQIGELAIFSNRASDGSHCQFNLTIYSNPQNLSIRDFWKTRLTNVYRDGHLVSVYNFKSANDIQFGKNNEMSGVKFSMEREDWSFPNESMAIIAKKNDNIIELFWWGRDPYISTPECSKIDSAFSTFRFLEDKDKEITITSPIEGDVWKAGKTYQIRWTPNNTEGTVVIKLYKVPISSLSLKWESSYSIPNTGSYSFTSFDSLEEGKYQFLISKEKSDEFFIVSK